jgi:hypothetical protein
MTTTRYDQLIETFRPRMTAVLNGLREALDVAGWDVTRPEEFCGDDFALTILAERRGFATVDISFTICDARTYGDEYGWNFTMSAVEAGGRVLMHVSPFNYTEQCWTDDDEELGRRMAIFETAEPSDIVEVLEGASPEGQL